MEKWQSSSHPERDLTRGYLSK